VHIGVGCKPGYVMGEVDYIITGRACEKTAVTTPSVQSGEYCIVDKSRIGRLKKRQVGKTIGVERGSSCWL
jgi:hypothetical protein